MMASQVERLAAGILARLEDIYLKGKQMEAETAREVAKIQADAIISAAHIRSE
jgi:hypothetical protein